MNDSDAKVFEFSSDLNGHDRKLVHEIANELSLIHESTGSGKKRHVVLKKDESADTNNVPQIKNENKLPRRDILPGERPKTPPSVKYQSDSNTGRKIKDTPSKPHGYTGSAIKVTHDKIKPMPRWLLRNYFWRTKILLKYVYLKQ